MSVDGLLLSRLGHYRRKYTGFSTERSVLDGCLSKVKSAISRHLCSIEGVVAAFGTLLLSASVHRASPWKQRCISG